MIFLKSLNKVRRAKHLNKQSVIKNYLLKLTKDKIYFGWNHKLQV
jgi:hypothetical protein